MTDAKSPAIERPESDRSGRGVGSDAPLVSVIVVSFNTRDSTVVCLETILQDCRDIPHEVWLVDNASSDGSVAAIRDRFPTIRMIENPQNLGFGAANNRALQHASGEFVFLLNSDAFVRPGTVNALIDFLRRHPDTAAVGPRLLNEDGSLQQSCYRFPSPARAISESFLLSAAFPDHPVLGDGRNWPHDREAFVDFVIGAACLVRRQALEKVGGFDEAFFLYAEETDLCFRLHQAGWKTGFTPNAEVVHLSKGSGRTQSAKVFSEFHHAKELYFRKHYGLGGLALYRFSLFSGALLRVMLFGMLLWAGKTSSRNVARFAEWKRILRWVSGQRGERLQPMNQGH